MLFRQRHKPDLIYNDSTGGWAYPRTWKLITMDDTNAMQPKNVYVGPTEEVLELYRQVAAEGRPAIKGTLSNAGPSLHAVCPAPCSGVRIGRRPYQLFESVG